MKTIAALVLSCLFLPCTLVARIGETPTQCKQRYGEPLDAQLEYGRLIFKKAGLMVICEFRNEKCALVAFRSQESDILDRPEPMSEAQQEALMEANGGSATWQKTEAAAIFTRTFQSSDGLLQAWYSMPEHYFFVATVAEIKLREQERAAADKAKLKDF